MHKSKMKIIIILFEIAGFAIVIFLLWADEVFDIPHKLFGADPTPINCIESLIETVIVFVLGVFTTLMSWMFLNRIKYLEGFLIVCSFCKRIQVNENWISIEDYIKSHSGVKFSHGLCPECTKRNYGQLFDIK